MAALTTVDSAQAATSGDRIASLEREIASLRQRLAAARQIQISASFELAGGYAQARRTIDAGGVARGPESQLRDSGIFDPETYLALNPDLATRPEEAWHHFWEHGLAEGRLQAWVYQWVMR